jgi:hypothetical protein
MPATKFAVVGAGIAGLACARRLVAAGHAVCVFDKARQPGGRLATRRTERATWDHGAQYFTASDAGFAGLLRAARDAAQVATWTPRWPGGEQEQRDLWVGVPGMPAFGRWLATGIELIAGTQIVSLLRESGSWTLRDDRGGQAGGFDTVVLAMPAPQAGALAAGHTPLAERVAAVPMAPCWTVMVAFGQPLPATVDADWSADPVLPWIARNSSKPRRSGLDAWVLHADADWSREHLETDAGGVREQLLARLATRLGTTLPPPDVAETHRWRYARVLEPLGEAFLLDAATGLGFCGDWCLDARVEAAFLSGDALGQTLAGPGPG